MFYTTTTVAADGSKSINTSQMGVMMFYISTVTCEAGFSDGSSASGVEFKVLQGDKVIIEGKFDKDSMYTFKKPEGEYKARMFAGEGHEVIVEPKDISK